MVEWIQVDEFKRAFAELRESRLFFDAQINFDLDIIDIPALIPFPPEIYSGGLEEPGPCKRWYGRINGILFSLVGYDQTKGPLLRACPAQIPHGQYLWCILNSFIDLPKPMLKRVAWIRGHGENAKESVCLKDPYGIVREVYRAESHLEARELLIFLMALGSEDRYFLQNAEDLTSNWVIIRKSLGVEDEIVGRYTTRGSAQYMALIMSQHDSSIYEVRKENKPVAQ